MADIKKTIRNWCAKQERSSFEVAQKLVSWNIDNNTIHGIIEDLKRENFLNDERFAEDYARGKFRMKNWGKKKIKLFLLQKKISEPIVERALSLIDEDEYEGSLQKLAQKRVDKFSASLSDFEKKGKLYQYLLSKGFESNRVREVIDEVLPS